MKEDFVEEKVGDSFCGDGFLGRAKNHSLSKPMVDHDQKRVKASGEGKVRDEIAGKLLEGAGGSRVNGSEGWSSRVCIGFVLLADRTSLDIFSYKGYKIRLPEFGSNQLACL